MSYFDVHSWFLQQLCNIRQTGNCRPSQHVTSHSSQLMPALPSEPMWLADKSTYILLSSSTQQFKWQV